MLVDLETVKGHLRKDFADGDENLVRKIRQGSAIVRDYLKVSEDEWDADDTEADPLPYDIEAAVLLVIEALYLGTEPLSQTVKDLLHRHRDPALA